MIFDWLATHWIGLLVYSFVWTVVWVILYGLFAAWSRRNGNSLIALTMLMMSIVMLWLSNLPFWAGIVGLVCAIIKHFTGG